MPILSAHFASLAPPIQIEVQFEREGVTLWLRFVVEGEVDGLAWPALADQERADALWERTCFEAFVSTDDGYVEYNLSPSGQWATYRFDSYRDGMREATQVATVLGLDGACDMAALEARIELPVGATRLGLSAIIEATDGSISYWALAHPSAKPDFHHPDSFVLELS
jgi:hypothetical protein